MNDRKLVLNADQLRKLKLASKGDAFRSKVRRNEIYIILDNVLDTYNIGSIFRLADAVAAKKVYLCGATETPPNHRIKKASINTTEVVDWEYCESVIEAIEKVRNLWKCHPEPFGLTQDGLVSGSSEKMLKQVQHDSGVVIAVEQVDGSIQYDKFEYKLPIALIVGHESDGVSQKVLKLCDGVVELPMFGINKSLNVMVSLGIVLYEVISKTSKQ